MAERIQGFYIPKEGGDYAPENAAEAMPQEGMETTNEEGTPVPPEQPVGGLVDGAGNDSGVDMSRFDAIGNDNAETEGADVETPRGRAAILQMWKEANPDFTGDDIDDNALSDFIYDKFSEINKQYGDLSEANKKLAETVSNNPQLAVLLSEVVKGEHSIPYVIANLYGKDFLELQGPDLEDFDKGMLDKQMHDKQMEEQYRQSSENIAAYMRTMNDYSKKNKLDETRKGELMDKIQTSAEDILMGKISPEFIDFIYKGMNYDKDIQNAADTGVAEGRNQKIKAKLKKVQDAVGENIPDLNNAGLMNDRQRPVKRRGSFYDQMS